MKNLLIILTLVAAPAFANTAADKAYCEKQDPAVDRKACMLEQRNARAAMKSGALDTIPAYRENQLKRCDVFMVPEDKRSCIERVLKGMTTGSVASGGTITEHREIIKK